jgi:hypothetical protein
MLAALVGATHVERNGHHYVYGMAGAPFAEQAAFLDKHADLYRRAPDGRARLNIRDDAVSFESISRAAALASAVVPDFGTMGAGAVGLKFLLLVPRTCGRNFKS